MKNYHNSLLSSYIGCISWSHRDFDVFIGRYWLFNANDRLHTNSSTNSTQDHVWSPFLMVYVLTAITISLCSILPILNIQLHSKYFCNCNCPLKKFNVSYSYALQEFVNFLGGMTGYTPTRALILHRITFDHHF